MQFQAATAASALAPAADLRSAPAQPLLHRMWPPAMIAFGLGLTAAWTGLLGYGLVSLTAPAFRVLLDFLAF
jgi:hypothetical protein